MRHRDADEVILDTCAVIWLAKGIELSRDVLSIIDEAASRDNLLVSTATAWEIGMLGRRRPDRTTYLDFRPDPKTWFSRFMDQPGVREAPITPEIAIDASFLPGDFHNDPGDRFIVATARHRGAPIVTRDRKIVAYADIGHVSVIPC